MTLLHMDPDYIQVLIVKIRAHFAREDTDVSDPGGNASDDPIPMALQELPGDLTREELIEEIQGLSERQQAELVALMWIGREDGDPDEWQNYIETAIERRETPTEDYLLDHPLLAEYLSDGLQCIAPDLRT